ncbi:hypothetical protein CNR22_06660 [Sphingobacteriaceae bacterium]|nr:hypothetical protein CNR22_06660 [Sphingobacteriaceae bacterium]
MKKIFILGLILSCFVGRSATFTWTGASSTSYTTAANWNLGLSGIPGPGDDLVFPALVTVDCIIPAGVGIDVGMITMQLGYAGTFNMGNGVHNIATSIAVNGGTLAVSSNSTFINNGNGSITSSGSGLFSATSGTVIISSNAGNSFTFSGGLILNHLYFTSGGGTSAITIDFGSNLSVGTFSMVSPGARQYVFVGTAHIKNTLSLGNASNTTNNTSNTGTFIFDGTGANIIASTSGAGTAYLANVTMNTTGSYSLSGSLNLRGNYSFITGTLVPGTSTVNMYGTGATINGASSFDNLALQAGSSVTFPLAEVLINKDFNVISGASATFPAGSVLGFNGSSTISGTFTPQNITVKNGSSATLANAVSLIDALTVEAGATFNSAGFLTLQADASGTARVAQIGAGGAVNGNVIVETFLPGPNTDWANLGIRGVQSQPISSWDAGAGGPTGIPMTCYGCIYEPADAGDFKSIQGWDEPNSDYDTLMANINSTTILTPGKGFWVYVGSGSASTTDLKLVNTGVLVQGSVGSPAITNSGSAPFYNLVANPYPSTVSWASVLANNGGDGFLVYDAIYAYSAEGGDLSYVGGVGLGLDDNITGGQGFYVENAGFTTGPLMFSEADKVSTTNPIVKPNPTNYGQIFKLKLSGLTDNDETAFRIHEDATAFYDKKWDAHKMFKSPGYLGYPGAYSKYTSISSKDAMGDDYSIHSVPSLFENRTIPLLVRVSTSGTYTIHAHDYKDYTGCVGLRDNLTNTFHDLKQSDYVFTISDTTSAPRFDLVLCRDESLTVGMPKEYNSGSILINQDQQGAFVKTAFSKNTKATISAYNLIGQKIMEDINVEGTGTNTRLNIDMQNQIVIIRVVTDKESSTKKIVMH